jgi:hypothetical protein
LVPELLDSYSAMMRSLVDKHYAGATRYPTSGFLRIQLGNALEKLGVASSNTGLIRNPLNLCNLWIFNISRVG